MSFFITYGVGRMPLKKQNNIQTVLTKYGYTKQAVSEKRDNKVALELAKKAAGRAANQRVDTDILKYYCANPDDDFRSTDEINYQKIMEGLGKNR